jgi:hypothetical protein
MRKYLLVLTALATLAAQARTPAQIAFVRIFPNAGQVGLFIAAADGTRVQQLTDNQWEDGSSAWWPTVASSRSR